MSLINDVKSRAMSKLAALNSKLASDITPANFGALPYIGVDTQALPNIDEALMGRNAETPIRVSPASAAWRGALTGGLPAGIAEMVNAKLNDSVDPIMHGRPGNKSSIGLMGHVQPTEGLVPGRTPRETMQNRLFRDINTDDYSWAENSLKSGLDSALNSTDSRNAFKRNAIDEYLKAPSLPEDIPIDRASRWNNMYANAKSQGRKVGPIEQAAALKRLELGRIYDKIKNANDMPEPGFLDSWFGSAPTKPEVLSGLNSEYDAVIDQLIEILRRKNRGN